MQLRFGADVRTLDGDRLGTLERVLVEGATGQVVGLIARDSRAAGGLKAVPTGAVDQGDDSELYVDTSRDQFDSLPDFTHERNLAPPPDTENMTEEGVSSPLDVPDVAPVGAATGIESIAFTPIIQEQVDVPEGDTVLSGSTEVWATDGHLGNLSGVDMSDQTRRVTDFLVREGMIFTHVVIVPITAVESVGPDRIVLSVTSASLHRDGE